MHRIKNGLEVLSVAISECKESCNNINTHKHFTITTGITVIIRATTFTPISANISTTVDYSRGRVTPAERP